MACQLDSERTTASAAIALSQWLGLGREAGQSWANGKNYLPCVANFASK